MQYSGKLKVESEKSNLTPTLPSPVGRVSGGREGVEKKPAFTLAEVLITLGVIGVVASMTIPTLIKNHKKSVVATKLQYASSVLLQAYNMATIDYGENREFFSANDADTALEMFEKYYVPYIKFVKVEKGEKGVFGYLPNGSVLYFRRYAQCGTAGWGCTYNFLCINNKACSNIDEEVLYGASNGKDVFTMYTSGKFGKIEYSHDELVNRCKNQSSYIESCTQLIFESGWQIPDDYPIKL